jgi:hypothetical protein
MAWASRWISKSLPTGARHAVRARGSCADCCMRANACVHLLGTSSPARTAATPTARSRRSSRASSRATRCPLSAALSRVAPRPPARLTATQVQCRSVRPTSAPRTQALFDDINVDRSGQLTLDEFHVFYRCSMQAKVLTRRSARPSHTARVACRTGRVRHRWVTTVRGRA